MPSLALIGYPLSHSFSGEYFSNKFSQLGLPDWRYELFPLEDLNLLADLIDGQRDLVGFNVTIPHKIAMIPYCNRLSEEAEMIGAVNCVKVSRIGNGVELIGYNTDAQAFRSSLTDWYRPSLGKAIIYGNGGAARAVQYVLGKMNIPFIQVVRKCMNEKQVQWHGMNPELFSDYDLIINCTPVGMYPWSNEILPIKGSWIRKYHHFYDLVYNPDVTATMHLFNENGAKSKNGLEMLSLQAENAWEIWQ